MRLATQGAAAMWRLRFRRVVQYSHGNAPTTSSDMTTAGAIRCPSRAPVPSPVP